MRASYQSRIQRLRRREDILPDPVPFGAGWPP